MRCLASAFFAVFFLGLGAALNATFAEMREPETVIVSPPALISWWATTAETDTPRGVATPIARVTAPVVQQPAPVVALRMEVPSGEVAVRQALAVSSWPSSLWEWVIRVARCESGLRANPSGGDSGGSVGLMQINTRAHADLVRRFELTSLAGNLEAAWIVYTQRGGARAWSCK